MQSAGKCMRARHNWFWFYLGWKGGANLLSQLLFDTQMKTALFIALAWSRWLDIGQVLFLRIYGPRRSQSEVTREKEWGKYPAIFTEKASLVYISQILLQTNFVLFQLCYKWPKFFRNGIKSVRNLTSEIFCKYSRHKAQQSGDIEQKECYFPAG